MIFAAVSKCSKMPKKAFPKLIKIQNCPGGIVLDSPVWVKRVRDRPLRTLIT